MNLKNLAFVTLGCALAAGCSGSNGSGGVVTVDFHSYEERPIAEMAEPFYSARRYIALHAEDQNLMIGEIGKVILHGDRIYVSEPFSGINRRQNLVMHDSEGRAVAKIGNKGRGPGEYLQIGDFDVDATGRVHLLDMTNGVKKIFIYAPDGKYIGEKPLPFSADMIKCTPGGGYLFELSPYDKSENAGKRIVKTDANLVVENSAGEFHDYDLNQLGSGWSFSAQFITTPEGICYQKSPDENLFLLDGKGNITKTLYLDLGRYAIPVENRNYIEDLYNQNQLKPYRIPQEMTAKWGRYIIGCMRDGGMPKSYILDIETGVNYTFTVADAALFENFITISDGRLIASFPAFDGETLPAELPTEMRAGVLSGNPLLVLYSLK